MSKKTTLHEMLPVPAGRTYCGNATALDTWDAEKLSEYGVDEAWYWYGTEPYEGDGFIVMRKGELYDAHDMSHCSCYGPVENISFNWRTPSGLRANYEPNADLWKEVKHVFEAAGIA